MEEIQQESQRGLDTAPSWVENTCQKLLFEVLKQAKIGSFTIKYNGQAHHFGDQNASLKAVADIHHAIVFKNMITKGSIGVAEDYVANLWSSPDLTAVIRFFVVNQDTLDAVEKKFGSIMKLGYIFKKFKNKNSETQAKKNILAHYDLGNHLYRRFLDESMQYSSAIYPEAHSDLSSAQQNKMATICERLQLNASDKVIEIGTGWGGLAIFMAQHYGCHVTTTTISDAQYEYAEQQVKSLGLSDKITLLKQDYRKLEGKYDKLVSIEMIEAVGHEYLNGFFTKCSNLLKDDGLMLIQAITIADQRYDHYRSNVDFIQTYIFPGGCLPSVNRMSGAINKHTDLVIHGLHDIGLHYAKTLADWRDKFLESWPTLAQEGFDNQFKRLWLFYLSYCEGGFLERATSTVHLVARKPAFR